MSTEINANLLKNFIIKTIGGNKLTETSAQKYGIDEGKYVEANKDVNTYLELDEIIADSDLYEQFATMFVEDKEEKASVADKEKEKEELTKVQEKSESGV